MEEPGDQETNKLFFVFRLPSVQEERMIALLLSLVIAVIPACAYAESVELMDGRVFDGELVDETQDMMTVREAAGDGFIEAVYDKTEVRKFGARSIEDEMKDPAKAEAARVKAAGQSGGKPAIDFESRERVAYENSVKDIIDDIKRLGGIWRINHFDFDGFRQWFTVFNPKISAFKEKYAGQAVVSYTMMNAVFLQLSHFETAMQDMEKASHAYDVSVAKNQSDSWRSRFKQGLDSEERMAREAITNTMNYADVAGAKILKR
jgi:hypothetical protein